MQRVTSLLKKLEDLAQKKDDISVIDIDLMLDYTRVLYADLLETKSRVSFSNNIPASKDPEAEKDETPLPQQVATEKTVPPPTYVAGTSKDIRTHIGINDKYLFIDELFNNNKPEYDNAIKTLNGFDAFSDANVWIETELSKKYNWNKDSETTQTFYEVIKSFFSAI